MQNNTALVVGGSNGIGLAMVKLLIEKNYNKVIIIDKFEPKINNERIEYIRMDLTDDSVYEMIPVKDVDTLIITAGFGRATLFETIDSKEIDNSFKVNAVAVVKLIKLFYSKLSSKDNFECMVMGSIAGMISSPVFALYSATKAAVCKFIESINIELEEHKTANRILNVSPGSLKGTHFNGGENNLELLKDLTENIYLKMLQKEVLYIPEYETIYKKVLKRYNDDSHKYGIESYEYKMNSGRINNIPQIKVGYLSGTFDLFHIGHLNLLKKAKQYCDYIVVGVHKDASHKKKEVVIPYDERVEILKSVKYVDKVVQSKPEDIEMYDEIKYDYLFVGSDYKGTERFNRYEEYFKDSNTKIIYFPYTDGRSSTQIRTMLNEK